MSVKVNRWDAASVVRQKIKAEGDENWNEFKTAMKIFYRKQKFNPTITWDDHDLAKRRQAIVGGCRRYNELNGGNGLFGDINVEALVVWKLHDLHGVRYRNLRLKNAAAEKSGKQKNTESVDSNHEPSTEPEEYINQQQSTERTQGKRFDSIREIWVDKWKGV
ncbi:hypothetical protein MMC29_002314 [Sticta canariensis]|nr:hypothetical protein [Sticta canariensis]